MPSPAKPKHEHRYSEIIKQQSNGESQLRTKAPSQQQDHKVFCGRPNKEKYYEANHKEEKEGRAKHCIERVADVCVNLSELEQKHVSLQPQHHNKS
jgi:hypothetical protein